MGGQKIEEPAVIANQKTHEPFLAREFFDCLLFLIWRSLVREQIIAYAYKERRKK